MYCADLREISSAMSQQPAQPAAQSGPGRGNYDRTQKKAPIGVAPVPQLLDLNLSTEEDAIIFLEENGIIPPIKDEKCPDCGGPCGPKGGDRPRQVKCKARATCNKSFSRMRGTFFEGSKIPLHKILHLLIMCLLKMNKGQIMAQTGLGSQTVTDYMRYFRQLVSEGINAHKCVIGSKGVKVKMS